MRNYEVTFIVDPVLSGEEIKSTAQTYSDMLKEVGAEIIHIDEMGLRTLAYPINRRNSGVYYCIEVVTENGEFIDGLELAFRRDERIMRFLSYRLDKFGVKYNEDKRNGLIGKAKRPKKAKDSNDRDDRRKGKGGAPKRDAKPAPKAKAEKPAAPKEETKPVAPKAEKPVAPKEEAKPAPKAEKPVAPKEEAKPVAPAIAEEAAKQEEE